MLAKFKLRSSPTLYLLVKLVGVFCISYYGTLAIEGLAAPGHYYSPFINRYLDYPAALRSSLLWGTQQFAALCGRNAFLSGTYLVRIEGGAGVQLVYSCLGIGVMSCWVSFVLANKGYLGKKLKWILGGLMIIWIINVIRMGILLVQNNTGSKLILGIDNHLFFNIAAYSGVLFLMFLYGRNFGK